MCVCVIWLWTWCTETHLYWLFFVVVVVVVVTILVWRAVALHSLYNGARVSFMLITRIINDTRFVVIYRYFLDVNQCNDITAICVYICNTSISIFIFIESLWSECWANKMQSFLMTFDTLYFSNSLFPREHSVVARKLIYFMKMNILIPIRYAYQFKAW